MVGVCEWAEKPAEVTDSLRAESDHGRTESEDSIFPRVHPRQEEVGESQGHRLAALTRHYGWLHCNTIAFSFGLLSSSSLRIIISHTISSHQGFSLTNLGKPRVFP